ncbi:unnamed protein product, partial [Hymenolepis diminuta]
FLAQKPLDISIQLAQTLDCLFKSWAPNRIFSLHVGETQKLHLLWTGLLTIEFQCQNWTYKTTCREAVVAIIG